MEKLDLIIPVEVATVHYTFILYPDTTLLLSAYCWIWYFCCKAAHSVFQADQQDVGGGNAIVTGNQKQL
jgi:hypothetical protein